MTANQSLKKKSWLVFMAIILIPTLACLSTTPPTLNPRGPSYGTLPTETKSNLPNVTYEITGTAYSAFLTWENSQGGTEQGDYSLPFKKSFSMDYGDFAYISAQNKGDSGTVICRILVNGIEWKKSTSSGAYVIATCSGIVGGE